MQSSYSSKFIDLYKSHNLQENFQEKRRQVLLNEQKERRTVVQDSFRNIQNFARNLRHRKKVKYLTYGEKYDSNYQLQLSEWLKEKPNDLNNWYLVPCPKGQRCLVIAIDGRTEVYAKNGNFLERFHTMLPGDMISGVQSVTILDCIFIEKLSTYFILDILAYGNQDFINCDAAFRFFWITSKFSDNESVHGKNVCNRYPFMPLLYYDFEDEFSIVSCLSKFPQWDNENIKLDGFLFYHKEASYTCGISPLVGWLFAFMIPEVLQIHVNEEYMKEKPLDYVDYLHYIIIFDENMAKKKQKRNKRHRRKMELDDQQQTETFNINLDEDNHVPTVDDDNSNSNFMEILNAEKLLELEGRLNDDFDKNKSDEM